MTLLIPTAGDREFLLEELATQGLSPYDAGNGLLQCQAPTSGTLLAFCQQSLPEAEAIHQASIRLWAEALCGQLLQQLDDHSPWQLHLWPAYGEGRAGLHRCELIADALRELLKKRRRCRLPLQRQSPDPTAGILQGLLLSPEQGWVSAASPALCLEQRPLISPWVAGWIAPAVDKQAPSRAFAKLVESLARLNQGIARGQQCVDLGAAPGSWSHVALAAGAQVTAVDRSPLRADLMANPRLRFVAADAFGFAPDSPVDWLLCDVIAEPQRSIDLLLRWLRKGWMRHFVVTIKFKGDADYGLLQQIKREAPSLCVELRLQRLCSNKNEVCVFGTTVLQNEPPC